MKKLHLLAIAILFLCSCAETEEPTTVSETELLSIKVLSTALNSGEQGIVMTHTETGSPIGYARFSNGATLNIDVEKGKKYHLTVISKKFNIYEIETYSFMQDRQITLGNKKPEMENFMAGNGIFVTFITHHSDMDYGNLSSNLGIISNKWSLNSKKVQLENSYFANSSQYLLSARTRNGEIRYKLIDRPERSSFDTYEFSKLLRYDKELTLPTKHLQRFIFKISSLKREIGTWRYHYIIDQASIGDNPFPMPESTKLGFIDQFEDYETIVTGIPNAVMSSGYYKVGAIPTDIKLPEGQKIDIESRSIIDFKYSTSFTHNHFSATYYYSPPTTFTKVNWTIHGDRNNLKVKSLHADANSLDPALPNINELRLTSITAINSSMSYTEILKEKFQTPDPFLKLEYTWLKSNAN
ncbi:hypothetical protein [Pararhodonellum marinum]|uniref:hypothetical protein n=1 Tax=Pararhodonellum marinum TaxID=2755358 RepID=UPI00188E9F43|nr:hypothetical protein [Pararhodonellum marinum]